MRGTQNKSESPDLARLLDILAAFPGKKIVVLGDLVVDEFVTGQISRVSREAPVLILQHRRTEMLPGGGANAANNLADLGAKVVPVGVVGEDAPGKFLVDYFRRKKIDTSAILSTRHATTTTKSRYMAGWAHKSGQQVLRVDRQPEGLLPATVYAALERKLALHTKKASAVLVSDYGCGAVNPSLVRKLRAPIVTLDSRYALLEYRGAHITAATPNEPELEALYHTRIGNDRAKLENLASRTRRHLGAQALVVTRGKDGMTVFEHRRAPHAIPIFGTDEAADVTGAGDTVIAVFTLALAAGANFVEAAHLANYAGGIVVMKHGTATITRAELESAVRQDATSHP
ncbi:MAG: bifunctional heptose 7-phosphate kinase/heptose 1-phosphate adenyltransferase [Candidatus Acidiferrales bacterium]